MSGEGEVIKKKEPLRDLHLLCIHDTQSPHFQTQCTCPSRSPPAPTAPCRQFVNWIDQATAKAKAPTQVSAASAAFKIFEQQSSRGQLAFGREPEKPKTAHDNLITSGATAVLPAGERGGGPAAAVSIRGCPCLNFRMSVVHFRAASQHLPHSTPHLCFAERYAPTKWRARQWRASRRAVSTARYTFGSAMASASPSKPPPLGVGAGGLCAAPTMGQLLGSCWWLTSRWGAVLLVGAHWLCVYSAQTPPIPCGPKLTRLLFGCLFYAVFRLFGKPPHPAPWYFLFCWSFRCVFPFELVLCGCVASLSR